MGPTHRVFTIGHSNHSIEEFLRLLRLHEIEALVDVRSTPFSRWQPQFNRDLLAASLRQSDVEYLFMGKELGARSQDRECYEGGRVRYDRLSRTELFLEGIEQIVVNSAMSRMALMCAEREPLECHRTILVGRALQSRGVDVVHIQGDGRLEAWSQAVERLLKLRKVDEGSLFESRDELIERAFDEQGEQIAYQQETAEAATI